ncbi:procathepsin L-like [Lytechinus variegatus]|uniref:procathepsin L-like n=1 Tax=Lytechinus variegatus TaxID=7654 RepID=UPI001BB2514E|nr:procathepsin L-like [Lytechinus variegatus]
MARNLLIIAVLLMVAVFHETCGRPANSKAWTSWKSKYGKEYSTKEEELVRWKVWIKNKQLVNGNNQAYDEGRRSFKMTMNEFADQDFGRINNNFDVEGRRSNTGLKETKSMTSSFRSSMPPSWDWRDKKEVNPVRDQGQIGSSLAMNVADAVASYSSIHNKTPLDILADAEVVDCCLPNPLERPGVFGCVHNHGGLCTKGTYHTGTGANVCNNASCKAVASCNVGKTVPSRNESALAQAVLFTPVVVAIDASHMSFQLYQSGVYSEPSCSSTLLDHSLLLVGYGVDSGVDYWICRNSWGSSWGDNGYINIARNHDNMCGIATDAIYPSNK